MLRNVLKAKGKQLACKTNQRLVWWSGKRWHSVISVIPALAEENPLWSRSEESLSSVHLFGLTPAQLQENLQRHWAQPIWRQWLQRLFSSIHQQLQIWSYYQQCLAFRELQQKEEFEIDSGLRVAIPPTARDGVMNKFTDWWIHSKFQFEDHLIKHSAHWLHQHFESELSRYEKQRKRKFLIRLQKEVKTWTWPAEEVIVMKKELHAAYQRTEESMRDYLLRWYRGTYARETPSRLSIEEGRVVAVAGSSVSNRPTTHTPQVLDRIEERDLSSFDLNDWVSGRRQRLNAILESREKDPTQQATHLLEDSLNMLILFVEPRLTRYREMIHEVLAGRNSAYEEVMEYMAHLQSRLLKMYRQGFLLFHPDHYQEILRERGHSLASDWNEVFLRYQHHVDISLTELATGQDQLAAYINNPAKVDQFALWCARMHKVIDQLILERHAFRKKMEAKWEEMEAQEKEQERKLREEMEEMKAKAKEQEAKAKEQEERINQLSELIMHHGLFPSPAQQGLENLPQEKLAGETRASFSQR